LGQAGRNHPPADEALEAAEKQKAEQLRLEMTLEPAAEPEEGERQRDKKADAAGENAMRPFPPEDDLELVEVHALVDLLVLRNLAVLVELLEPFRLVHRRDHAV